MLRLHSTRIRMFERFKRPYSSPAKQHETPSSSEKNVDDTKNDALTARFTQLLQDQIEANPNLINKLNEEAKYNQKYSAQLNYLKSEPLLKFNKHAKDIASSGAWTGQESTTDVNLRMIVDSLPKPKKIRNQGKRILNAKEISLDYQVNKDAPYEANPITDEYQKDGNDKFRELYKERLLGPSVLINGKNPNVALNLVNSLADAKINASIDSKTGQFLNDANMSKVRGKPLDKNHLANSRDSSYFVNQILNKQEVLPPWIENQQLLQKDIAGFRSNLDLMFVQFCKSTDYKTISKSQLSDSFRARQLKYVGEKIKSINQLVRDYNLQSPSSNFHKSKLVVSAEFDACVDRNYYQLDHLISQMDFNMKQVPISNTNQGFSTLFDNSKVVNQRPVNKINVWSSFKQMFSDLKQV